MIVIHFHMTEEGFCAAHGNRYFLITEKILWTFVKTVDLGLGDVTWHVFQ